jgi:hypothetical protein
MGLRTLYIGETTPRDTKYYYELDESACNLYTGNYETALEEKPAGVFYTSLSDFGKRIDILTEICLLFDEIKYRPPAVWSKDSVRYVTEEFVEYIIVARNMSVKFNGRKTEEPQIWVSGCSWSSAWCVTDAQIWATLLATKLNMPYTVLAEPGSGNSYQARKLLSADVRENDIVVFQTTTPHRETIIDPKCGHVHVHPSTYEQIPDLHKTYSPDRLDEITLVSNQIKDLQNVINFLEKIKARFMFWNPSAYLRMGTLLVENFRYKEYFYLYPDLMVDFGTDGIHPGPETHKKYADFVFEKLKQQEEQT